MQKLCPSHGHDILIVMRELDANVGNVHIGMERIMGKHAWLWKLKQQWGKAIDIYSRYMCTK